jgi:hypothetical protein
MGFIQDLSETGRNIVKLGLGLAFIVGTFQYGPVDLSRAVYNSLTGDTPVIKRQLGNYIVSKERLKNSKLEKSEFVKSISDELNIPITNGEINFQDAALDNLFDAAEERADFSDDWIWMKLDTYKNPVFSYDRLK